MGYWLSFILCVLIELTNISYPDNECLDPGFMGLRLLCNNPGDIEYLFL